jgi:flagellar biosynthesis anti-sigma factor FlgM
MKVQNANPSSLNPAEPSARNQAARAGAGPAGDDVHLSELVRSLRSLAADSPERQERIEQIARAYANGTYQVDADATASKIIDDSLQYP